MRSRTQIIYIWLLLVPFLALIEIGFGILELVANKGLYLGGSFINSGPSACFLACTVPLTIRMYRGKRNKIIRDIALLICVGDAILIPLSLSRTAIIALVVALAISFFPELKVYGSKKALRKRHVVMTIVITAVFATALVMLKPASAFGRFFIWKVTLSLFSQIPFDGVGWEFIESTYNNAQEAYFQAHPNSELEMSIAGSTNYLFNDFLSCAIAYGIYGVVISVAMFIAAVTLTMKHRQWEMLAGVCSFGVVMCGSYPLSCPQFIILGFMLWAGVFMLFSSKIISTVMILLSTGVFYILLQNIKDNNEYGRWLYSAIAWHEQGKYEDSNRILIEYLGPRVADVRILYLIGRNYQAMGQVDSAEYYYMRSILRVPSRHYPHYLLMNLYRETNRDSLALKEAAYLLEQPPKVQSQAIEDMKLEAASYIHYLDSYCDD